MQAYMCKVLYCRESLNCQSMFMFTNQPFFPGCCSILCTFVLMSVNNLVSQFSKRNPNHGYFCLWLCPFFSCRVSYGNCFCDYSAYIPANKCALMSFVSSCGRPLQCVSLHPTLLPVCLMSETVQARQETFHGH